jgi:PTS system mannose-specific IIA component
MLGSLVLTHGRFAEVLLESARVIVQEEIEALEAVSIDWNDDPEEATERIRAAIVRVDRGQGVLILTDMFGGTPTNLALALLEPGRVEIVTGVNLAMLIKFANLRGECDLAGAASQLARQGRESIQVPSQLLRPEGEPRGEL